MRHTTHAPVSPSRATVICRRGFPASCRMENSTMAVMMLEAVHLIFKGKVRCFSQSFTRGPR